jgi:hypothetical protein
MELVVEVGARRGDASWPRSTEELARELQRIACELVRPLTSEVLAGAPDPLEEEFVVHYRRAAEILLGDAGQTLERVQVDIDPGESDPFLDTSRARLDDRRKAADLSAQLVRIHTSWVQSGSASLA